MKTFRLFLSLLGAAALTVAAHATLVTVNTSSLAGGTYYVDFQLNDGNGIGDGNNTAVIHGFNFGGGVPTGASNAFGGVSGDLYSTVQLIDTDPFNEFYQSFTAGSFLSFNVNLSDNFNGSTPDAFAFAILDASLFNLATDSPGSDQFLTVDINGTGIAPQTFAGTGGVPAPHVPDASSTALLAAMGLLGVAGVRRRRHAGTARQA